MKIKVVTQLFFSAAVMLCSIKSSAIINGKVVKKNSPVAESGALISIVDGQQQYYCSGSLISNNIILTAAHCLTSEDYKHPQLKVFFTSLLNENSPYLQVNFSETVTHPGYSLSLLTDPNWTSTPDLALIYIDKAKIIYPFGSEGTLENYNPIKIGSSQTLIPGEQVLIAGYGYNTELLTPNKYDEIHPTYDRSVSLTSSQLSFANNLSQTVFTLEQGPSSMVCWEDSGSAAYLKNNLTNELELIGINFSINGYPEDGYFSCRNSKTASYVKVDKYLDWILSASSFLMEKHIR